MEYATILCNVVLAAAELYDFDDERVNAIVLESCKSLIRFR